MEPPEGYVAVTCPVCGRGFPPGYYFTQGRCQMCAQYWRRHGVERPLGLPSRVVLPPRPCTNCGHVVRERRGGRCRACYAYRRRTGRERPREWG